MRKMNRRTYDGYILNYKKKLYKYCQLINNRFINTLDS